MSKHTAQEQKNIETVQRFYQAANEDKLNVLDEIMAENFVTHGPATLLPFAMGRAAHKAGIGGFKQTFPDANIHTDLAIASGDRVMTRQTVTATHVNEFMGKAPTGKKLTWTATQIARFDDKGVMVERWVIEDFLGMFQQLGVMPTPK